MTVVDTATGEIVSDSLTAMERSDLTHAEAAIERGLSSFVEVGEALARVRDARLYRETFGTFEAYCRDRWGITDRRVRQMIDAAEVTNALPTGTIVPANEGQARALAGLAPEQAAHVMRDAEALGGGKITGAAIKLAREELYPKTPSPTIPQGEPVSRDVGEGQTPEGAGTRSDARSEQGAATGRTSSPAPVTGPRPPAIDHIALADAAVAEFPDLAYYRDEVGDLEHCWRLADSLRTLRERGELPERLRYLRRAIEVDRERRNGTYVSVLPKPTTCPTCGQTVKGTVNG